MIKPYFNKYDRNLIYFKTSHGDFLKAELAFKKFLKTICIEFNKIKNLCIFQYRGKS